jgi:hypothetical protein
LGLLASIGIQKGKKFDPSSQALRVFEQAIHEAFYHMQDYFSTAGKGYALRWPDRQWGETNLTQKQGFDFVQDGRLLIDERAGCFSFWATWLPKKLGSASAYLLGVRDRDGQLLSGHKSYRLRVPAVVPARDFWSVIVYSMKTKSMIPNAVKRAGLSSYDTPTLLKDSDGSVDLYFGPQAPPGKQTNWIPTGEDFFLLFRLYGPEQAFADKSWKLPDVEAI